MLREQAIDVITTYSNEEGLLVFPLAFPENSVPLAVIPLYKEDVGMIYSEINAWKEHYTTRVVNTIKNFEIVFSVRIDGKEIKVNISQHISVLISEINEKQKYFDNNVEEKGLEFIELFEDIRQTEFYLIDLALEVNKILEAIDVITKEYHEEMSDINNW